MTTSTHPQHFHFWPTERFGRWSVGSAVVFALGGLGLIVATVLGQTGGETFTDNWWLAGPAFVSLGGALSALMTGVTATIHEHDRSFAVILSTLIGLVVAVFVAGEIFVPH